MKVKTYDVIIIGGGVAGISAALWCDELGLSSVLLESDAELGGQLLWTYNSIKNHLGVEAENGLEMRNVFVRQIEERNFKLKLNAKVSEIDVDEKSVYLENDEKFSALALVIATGVKRRTLGISGEKRFQNKGILKSGKRDKDQVKGKRVLIIGGGDAALENALILSETSSEVYLAHRRGEFRAREEFIETAKEKDNVKFLFDTTLKEIEGDEEIESVRLENASKKNIYSLPIDAVLFRIGVEPNTKLLKDKLELDESEYIKVNHLCETNLKGIYAIGDVANPISPTISSANGMGATAIKAIYSRLNK